MTVILYANGQCYPYFQGQRRVYKWRYVNKYKLESLHNKSLIYNGNQYTLTSDYSASVDTSKLNFVGLTRWVPVGPWNKVYAEDADLPRFLVYGDAGHWIYWLDNTQSWLDTNYVRFKLFAKNTVTDQYDLICTKSDTFLLSDQVTDQPEYVTTQGGLSLSDIGLEEWGFIRSFFETPENCYRNIDFYEKDGSYYLEGYHHWTDDFRTEYYLIKPDSELMELVEMSKSDREVS